MSNFDDAIFANDDLYYPNEDLYYCNEFDLYSFSNDTLYEKNSFEFETYEDDESPYDSDSPDSGRGLAYRRYQEQKAFRRKSEIADLGNFCSNIYLSEKGYIKYTHKSNHKKVLKHMANKASRRSKNTSKKGNSYRKEFDIEFRLV